MNLVVTDGYALNSGDLSWQGIASFGQFQLYDRTTADEVVERCKEANIVIANKTPFSRDALAQLPMLKCICVTATGYNVIDTKAAAENGIVVCNVPGYGTASVAQHVFALLLELTNGVGRHSASVREGGWQRSADWCYTLQPIVELSGKTMGIVGYGNIGQEVAKIAAAFGMEILYFNPSPKHTGLGRQVTLDELFSQGDIVSLHCPLTQENTGFVNSNLLSRMKRSACIVNTARGPLINEEDLTAALNNGVIAGAALDVLSAEPPTEKHEALIKAKNCIVTPHNAWMSKEARQRVMEITEKNVASFLAYKPINRVA